MTGALKVLRDGPEEPFETMAKGGSTSIFHHAIFANYFFFSFLHLWSPLLTSVNGTQMVLHSWSPVLTNLNGAQIFLHIWSLLYLIVLYISNVFPSPLWREGLYLNAA